MVQPVTAYISVRLTPRAGRDELRGWRDGVLQARVAAPPVDGKANEALCRLVAAALDIAPSRVSVASGGTARTKRLRIEDIAQEEAASKLGAG